MSDDYRSMWKELGLNLEAHDVLLGVLGQGYQDIFMSQTNRPSGMQYFDFVMSEVHGLRIKELLDEKSKGHKVIGSFCVFVPEELVRATNSTLVGLCTGADFATDSVHQLLPTNTCALIKSAFGFKLGKVCPYIEAADMIVGENTCDGKKKSYEVLKDLVPNLYVMDLPQMKTEQNREMIRSEYVRFKKAIEELTGVDINVERLKNGIRIVNNKRAAIHRLATLRKAVPVPISGLDALLTNQVYFYDDPQRYIESVNKICDELEERIDQGKGIGEVDAPRILLSGCPMAVPNWKLPHIIESSGAVIVGEESCVGERGTRHFTDDSGQTLDELIDAIVDRYFKIDCAIFTPNPDRLDHIIEMANDYKADGVIHYGLQFCQPYQMEAFTVEKELKSRNIPVLLIDTDYSMEDVGQLSTRINAFLEVIKQ